MLETEAIYDVRTYHLPYISQTFHNYFRRDNSVTVTAQAFSALFFSFCRK
jgi:hypothetical protein